MKRLSICLLLCFVFPFSAVIGQDSSTLVIAAGSEIATFNPVFSVTTIGTVTGQMIYEPLFMWDPFTGLPTPRAANWEISEDGTTITFKLRDDLNWSDGTPVTAADVKFTFDAILSDQVASPVKGSLSAIQSVTIIDDKTFEVSTASVDCGIWPNLRRVTPLPSHKFAADFTDIETSTMNTRPDVGSGSYLFDDRVTDDFIRLKANPDFYGGKPAIEYLVFRVMPDPAVRNQAVMIGEADYTSMPGDQFESLTNRDNVNITPLASGTLEVLALNWVDPTNPLPAFDENKNPVKQPPHPLFGDVRVRQAIAMGYDRNDVLKTLGENGGSVLAGPIIPQIEWAYDSSIQPWAYDPEKAAALLDEAGWILNPATGIREKDGVPFAFTIDYAVGRPVYASIALVAQDQLSQIGINVSVNTMEFNALIGEKILPQKFDALIINFDPGSPNPNSVPRIYMPASADVPGSGINFTSYVNPEFDALVEQARTMPGCKPEDLAPLYSQIQQIAHDDVALDFVVSANFFHVMNKRVENFNPGTWAIYWNIEKWGIAG